eukprot:161164_1
MPSCFISGLGTIDYNQCEIYRNPVKDAEIDKTYCISQVGWSSGIHEFKMKVIALANGSTAIGVATNRTGFVRFKSSPTSGDWAHDWAFDSKYSGITYQLYYDHGERYRNFYYDGIYAHDKGKETLNNKLRVKWTQNDIIALKMDCDKWEISFYINDNLLGNTLPVTPHIKYYPAIAFGGNNHTKLRFIQ